MRSLARLLLVVALIAPQAAVALDPGKVPPITLGTGSSGDASAVNVTPSASAAPGTLARSIADQAASLAAKASLASPVFTGAPSMPSLTLTGTGSTGDVSGMIAGGLPLGPKLAERKSLLDFVDPSLRDAITAGTISTNVDLSSALSAARNYVAAGYGKLVIPAGVYPYSVSPNWAVSHARIACEGEVRFRYTGTGNAVIIDSGAVTGSGASLVVPPGKVDIGFCSPSAPLIVEAPATAGHAVFLRAIHHSDLSFNVRGAGSASAALYNEFGVGTKIHLTASVNEGGWYLGAKPKYGFILDARPGDPADYSAASYIDLVRPIIEGTAICGELRTTLGVRLLGGTTEACTTYGVDIQAGSTNTVIDHTDFEANTGFDARDNGLNTTLTGIQALAQDASGNLTSGIIVGATSRNLQIERGNINNIVSVAGAVNATIDRTRYNLYGNGGISDPADAFLIRSAYNVTTGKTHDALPLRTVLSGLPASATAQSPFQYNNTGRNPVTVLVTGGSGVQQFFFGKSGTADAINASGAVKLLPGEGLWFAYTAAPTIVVTR